MARAAEDIRYAQFVVSEAAGFRSREFRQTAGSGSGVVFPVGTIFDVLGNRIIDSTIGQASSILLRPIVNELMPGPHLVLARDAEVNDGYLYYVAPNGMPFTAAQIAAVNASLYNNSRIVVRLGVLASSIPVPSGGFFDGLMAAGNAVIEAVGDVVQAGAAAAGHTINIVLAIILPGRRRR